MSNYEWMLATKKQKIRHVAVPLAGALAMISLFSFMIYLSFASVDNVSITVKDKERISGKESSYYLVFTESEVFKNEDSMLQLKFDSSDVYSNLDIGETYTCKVNWYRVEFFSMYRNIIECK